MCLKEKFAIVAEKQRSAADIPNFRVGFWEFLEEDKRKVEKGEHDEANSSGELDHLISSPLKGRQTLWKRRNTRGKSFNAFANSRSIEI